MIHLEQVWKSYLQYVLKTSSKRLEDVLKTFLRDVLKTSWKRLEDVLKTYDQDKYIGLDQDVFWRRMDKVNIFVLIKTSWRRLEDVSWRQRRKTSTRRLQEVFIKTNVCWDLWATVSIPFKNLPFCVGYWHLGGQTQRTLAKWWSKLGVLVKIYIFSWDNMVFLWGICLLPEKMRLFFSIPNKYLPIVALYLEVLCRIIEYPAKSSSSEFIYGTRTAEFLGKRIPSVLISGKRIWEKSSLLWQ